jgi:hypothetical protein
MVKTHGLSHVALSVVDLDRSLAFYRSVFGVREYFRNDSRTTLISVLVSILGTGGMFIYLRFFPWLWWLGLYLILWPVLWAYIWWATKRRVLKLLGKSCEVRLTQSDFTIMSDGDSHTFPWKRFKSFQLDAENLYLFLGPSLAYILPIRQVGEAAIDCAKAHVETNSV